MKTYEENNGCFYFILLIGTIIVFMPVQWSVYIIPFISIVYFVYSFITTRKRLREVEEDVENKAKSITDLKKELSTTKNDLSKQISKETLLRDLLKSSNPFSFVSSLFADAELVVFKKEELELRYKNRPATKAADTVKYLKAKSREHLILYKEMLYKYEFLLKSFPEISKYIDDYEALNTISKYVNYTDLEENEDRVFQFLSMEEWNQLTIDERNQLALERYQEREKSNWTIGIQYEMYIDYELRKNGFSTLHFGIKEGLNDLGRDIIAKKNGKYYIIQCKNWSKKKEIHENVICQLFGTTLEYKIEKAESLPMYNWDEKVFPVLYTTTELSNTAMKFAEKLGVRVIFKELGNYPMIKCNIGKNKEKIYHLPFDQQYYKVIIDEEKGEFYAWTVKEAVSKGFRRAYKFKGC